MLFIESVYRMYFGDDPADGESKAARPAELQVGGIAGRLPPA
jgi:hypothetical protein